MALTEAKIKANKKYDAAHYERISVLFPNGTKERIKSTGESINGFIVKAVLEKLENMEK